MIDRDTSDHSEFAPLSDTAKETPRQIEFVKVRVLPDGRMDSENAARYLGYQKKTLANLRSQGKGPRATPVGGLVYYFKNDLDAYIAGNKN